MFGTFALVGFPLGILVGYFWRDRISKARAARYWAEHKRRYLLGGSARRSTPQR